MSNDLFDFSNDSSTSFDVLPAGIYPATIDECELKDTKDGTGKYIKCTFRVFEGEANGRKVFHNFNIMNKNEKAAQIGRGQLKSYMECAGMKTTKIESPLDLVGFKVLIKTKVRADADYGDKAEISYFKAYEAQSAQAKPSQSGVSPF